MSTGASGNDLFPGFETVHRTVPGGEIFTRVGGAGPPLLLLHGYPETHAMWHAVAPKLAEKFRVVVADLRGYGRSFVAANVGAAAYTKRAMANDMVALMGGQGHEKFGLVGHDRGARVAYRLALDHPDRVSRLMLLDIITSYDVWATLDRSNAMRMWHWTFLAQPSPFPETHISRDPSGWVEERFKRGAATLPAWLDLRVLADYHAAFSDPARVAASCDDYRAGAGLDVEHDAADLAAKRRINAPIRLLWGKRGNLSDTADPLALWAKWSGSCADALSGAALNTGHFIPEEAPEIVINEILAHFT